MKKLVLNETQVKLNEDLHLNKPRGYVIVKNFLGETIYEGENKVVVAGSLFTASKHFNKNAKVFMPTYNEILGLENTKTEQPKDDGVRKGEQVFLFAVGTDGCGKGKKKVTPVRYTSWISPDSLVPFRYRAYNNDLNNNERQKYYGRKLIESDNRIAYYFKRFEDEPEIIPRYLDGTIIDENVYTSQREDEVEVVVKLHLVITPEDCREFFNQTVGLEEGELSSISLLTAWAENINGMTYYQDIRPLTKYHFPAESLIENSKGLDITYMLYY